MRMQEWVTLGKSGLNNENSEIRTHANYLETHMLVGAPSYASCTCTYSLSLLEHLSMHSFTLTFTFSPFRLPHIFTQHGAGLALEIDLNVIADSLGGLDEHFPGNEFG